MIISDNIQEAIEVSKDRIPEQLSKFQILKIKREFDDYRFRYKRRKSLQSKSESKDDISIRSNDNPKPRKTTIAIHNDSICLRILQLPLQIIFAFIYHMNRRAYIIERNEIYISFYEISYFLHQFQRIPDVNSKDGDLYHIRYHRAIILIDIII